VARDDREQKIARPRQLYLGPGLREFVPAEKRDPDEAEVEFP
jgi:citrate synthase